jgi:hypothetical protein
MMGKQENADLKVGATGRSICEWWTLGEWWRIYRDDPAADVWGAHTVLRSYLLVLLDFAIERVRGHPVYRADI